MYLSASTRYPLCRRGRIWRSQRSAKSAACSSENVVGVSSLRCFPRRVADFTRGDGLAALKTLLLSQPVDLVLSDMAPNISGIPMSDQARSMELCELALEFALEQLQPGGAFLVKVFQGDGFAEYYKLMAKSFLSYFPDLEFQI